MFSVDLMLHVFTSSNHIVRSPARQGIYCQRIHSAAGQNESVDFCLSF